MTLIESALTAGIAFKAILANAFYGDHIEFTLTLIRRGLPYVLSHSGQKSQGWDRAELPHSFKNVAQDTPRWEWHVVTRQFRDGHHERWWAAELTLFGYGHDRPVRAVCVTTYWRALPKKATWYLTTNLTREEASLAEVIRLYGLRIWVEENYKRMKDELGWAAFMVHSDRAFAGIGHWCVVRLPSVGGMKPIGHASPMPRPKWSCLLRLNCLPDAKKNSGSDHVYHPSHAGPGCYEPCESGWPRYTGSHVAGKRSSTSPHQHTCATH